LVPLALVVVAGVAAASSVTGHTQSSVSATFDGLQCGTTYTVSISPADSPQSTVTQATDDCPPPPPPPNDCTKTLATGGSLSSFVNSLEPGDVGCVHGGTYADGSIVTWTASGTSTAPITVTSYPGETAEIVGSTFYLDGSYQVMSDLTVRDVTCSSCDGIAVSGAHNRVEHNVVRNVDRQGILLHTDASSAVITRNDVRDIGEAGSNQDHGVYVQGDGHIITNNVFANIRGGYGIHVYPSSSNVIVAENTVSSSQTRSGIVIDTTGGNITVVNNISVGNTEYGVLNRKCELGGCVVDDNLAWGNGLGPTSGSAANTILANPLFSDSDFHLLVGSLAIDTARSDFVYSPDKDGVARPQGLGADLGAYER
jgi:hypothetical protein